MVRMFVCHEVANYEKWRKVYDEFGGERSGFGVVGDAVGRSVENGNEVTVTHDFGSLEEAKAFIESPRLKEAMQTAGVTGQPTIWFTELA
jgi:hypothetical protein